MNSIRSGKVYLVGSGPGDPEILTLKAHRLIDEADVVVYDQLSGKQILSSIPEGTEKIDASKYAGSHTLKQEQINQVLVREKASYHAPLTDRGALRSGSTAGRWVLGLMGAGVGYGNCLSPSRTSRIGNPGHPCVGA